MIQKCLIHNLLWEDTTVHDCPQCTFKFIGKFIGSKQAEKQIDNFLRREHRRLRGIVNPSHFIHS